MHNIFQSAILKLTFFYLVIVMAISLLFSGVVYRIATDEVAIGLRNQTVRIYQEYPVFDNNPFFERQSDIRNSAHHLLTNLIYLNLLVLATAGLASYWLAKRTLDPIEQANEQQKQFVADASHELRTPLTALKMESEVALMDEHASATELRAALSSNLEEAGKLETLLNNLLRLSRLEDEAIEQTFAIVAADDVISQAIDRVKRPATEKGITLGYAERNNAKLFGDRESLVQLLVILLDNAVKYSHPNGSVAITASTHAGQSTISVKDHGTGIDPAALEHVFDRFYRADRARTSNGYGLGLAIAKRLTDLHHGTITLKSTVGKGATALVTLPNKPVVR